MIRSEYRTWLDEIEGRKRPLFSNAQVVLVLVFSLIVLGVLGVGFGGIQ